MKQWPGKACRIIRSAKCERMRFTVAGTAPGFNGIPY